MVDARSGLYMSGTRSPLSKDWVWSEGMQFRISDAFQADLAKADQRQAGGPEPHACPLQTSSTTIAWGLCSSSGLSGRNTVCSPPLHVHMAQGFPDVDGFDRGSRTDTATGQLFCYQAVSQSSGFQYGAQAGPTRGPHRRAFVRQIRDRSSPDGDWRPKGIAGTRHDRRCRRISCKTSEGENRCASDGRYVRSGTGQNRFGGTYRQHRPRSSPHSPYR